MREIKFRAWDDEEKKMYSPEELEQPDISEDTRKTIYAYLSFGVLSIYDFRGAEPIEFLPLQSTGWFDKNNAEMYEGDILQVENTLNQIIWSEEIGGFVIMSFDGGMMMGGEYLQDVAVVEGNIYENPELLQYKGSN